MSPLFSLAGFWWLNCFVVLLKHTLEQVALKVGKMLQLLFAELVKYASEQQYQVESAALYVVSLSCFLFWLSVDLLWLNGSNFMGAYTLGIGEVVLLLAVSMFFMALSKVVLEQLKLTSARMGSDRPTALRRAAGGGWEANGQEGFYSYLLLGEVEFERHDAGMKASTASDIFACGCLSTSMELALFGGRQRRNSEEDNLIDTP
jgi:hypothetical protein